jgi:hypothetical protein
MAKPDFTGTWRFNPSKSRLQIAAPDSTIFVVDHREPLFRLARTHKVGQTSDEFELDLTTDNKEVSVQRADLLIRCRAYWEGDALVFDTQLLRAGESATNMVRYSLAPDGRSLIAEETFRSDALKYDNTWVLDKV